GISSEGGRENLKWKMENGKWKQAKRSPQAGVEVYVCYYKTSGMADGPGKILPAEDLP
ncbi:MAG: hypothetical protein IPG79_18425, partial [Saprospiraceae bacterium]|nr:hypothetical protein [Saprospiraceae bacterium]